MSFNIHVYYHDMSLWKTIIFTHKYVNFWNFFLYINKLLTCLFIRYVTLFAPVCFSQKIKLQKNNKKTIFTIIHVGDHLTNIATNTLTHKHLQTYSMSVTFFLKLKLYTIFIIYMFCFTFSVTNVVRRSSARPPCPPIFSYTVIPDHIHVLTVGNDSIKSQT